MSTYQNAVGAMPSRRSAAFGLASIPILGPALATCAAAGPELSKALDRGGPWLNSDPLRPAELNGKVVLVNFWTYTCINSLRPLPYLHAWAEKYRDRGLVVVGVHTPEFSFEHELARVRGAVQRQGVRYPVVLDNDFHVWRGLGNEAWPGFYLLDSRGRLRRRWLGEGDYGEMERAIQDVLGETRGAPVADPITPVAGVGAQLAADWPDLQSPETYLGYAKAQNFASDGQRRRDAQSRYAVPERLSRNSWGLSGLWDVGAESAALAEPNGAVAFRFHARDLHLVMGPGADNHPVGFRVRIDGAAPGDDHGADIGPDGVGQLEDARMYQLVRQAGPVRDRTFEVEFLAAGPRAYCFTFG